MDNSNDSVAPSVEAAIQRIDDLASALGKVAFELLSRAAVIGALAASGQISGVAWLTHLGFAACVLLGFSTAAEFSKFQRRFFEAARIRPLTNMALAIAVSAGSMWLLADVLAGVGQS